jgi:alpha-N-arabinofuranosidase
MKQTINYYVQQLFSCNEGDVHFPGIVSSPLSDTGKNIFASSCVKNIETGDIIIKLVNTDSTTVRAQVDLSGFGSINPDATCTVLTGDPMSETTFKDPKNIVPKTVAFTAATLFTYEAPAYSLTVIRVKPIN